jgi:alkylated DNA nucleotide flippase Atl1
MFSTAPDQASQPTADVGATREDASMTQLFAIDAASASPLERTTLTAAGLTERAHLQEWVLAHPELLGDDVLVITSEYDRWQARDGTRTARRLDILCLDRSGQLVVVELKRDDAPGDVHLQAITYAALVSRFDLNTLAQALSQYRTSRGSVTGVDSARDLILDHVGGDLDAEVLRSPRIVLVAGKFPREVTHTAVWLTERQLDIRLIQVQAWKAGEATLASFQQLWPVPELDTFTLAPARADSVAVAERVAQRTRASNAVRRLIDSGAMPAPTPLTIRPQHGVTNAQRIPLNAWLDAAPERRDVIWTNDGASPLQWPAGGVSGRPSDIVRAVAGAAGLQLDAVRGTTWFVDGSGRSLAEIADGVPDGGTRDWSDLHAALDVLPSGTWTTYGDLAQVVGTSAQALGTHLTTCRNCTNEHRVLNAEGKVASGFRWLDPDRTETPQQILEGEGITFVSAIADPARRLGPESIAQLVREAR